METITIERVKAEKKMGAKGEYTRLSLQTKERGWMSGFENSVNKSWAQGTILTVGKDLTIEFSKNLDKNGNPYQNFVMPKSERGGDPALEKRVAELERRIALLEKPGMTPAMAAAKLAPAKEPIKTEREIFADYQEPPEGEEVPF